MTVLQPNEKSTEPRSARPLLPDAINFLWGIKQDTQISLTLSFSICEIRWESFLSKIATGYKFYKMEMILPFIFSKNVSMLCKNNPK